MEASREKWRKSCVFIRKSNCCDGRGKTGGMVAGVSYDEKPGIQAIGGHGPGTCRPVVDSTRAGGGTMSYVRLAPSAFCGDRSADWAMCMGTCGSPSQSRVVDFLKALDRHYKPSGKSVSCWTITRPHLKETRPIWRPPHRFEFVFTPKHGSVGST